MKSLQEYLQESLTAKSWESITDKEKVTIDVLKNAIGGSSFMDDRAWANVDNKSFEKIGKNRWECHSNSAHALSETINDAEMLDTIQTSNQFKLMLPIL